MASALADAMDQLFELGAGIDLDAILEQEATDSRPFPPRPPPPSTETLEAELHDLFLTPASTFSTSWLNKLQQRRDTPVEHADVFKVSPPLTRTVTRFERKGINGRVVGYKTVTVPAPTAGGGGATTAKNSTSLLRRPAARTDFVRGAAGYFPFAPGGLDAIDATAGIEDQLMRRGEVAPKSTASKLERVIKIGPHGGLLEVAPGLTRGIRFAPPTVPEAKETAKEVERELDQEPADAPDAEKTKKTETERGVLSPHIPMSEGLATSTPDGYSSDNDDDDDDDDDDSDSGGVPIPLYAMPAPASSEDEADIDSILPVEFPAFEPHGLLAASSTRKVGREWAHMVDVNGTMDDFYELVPDMARTWPFEPDTFQKEAIYHLEAGDSVFVAAHTSAGKTVVAEYAIALAAKHMTKAIYTSPIKALSNQKFRDFRQTFDDVGILTGDVQVNPEASCLIMTTEILRSMLYRGADLIRDVEFVIFDEVHYVNDLERGVVWEEVIIMLPDHVSLILLSATVPNTLEFASWVGRTKKKNIYVISTPKRPVPLEHHLWAGKEIFKIVDNGKFYEKGWKDANLATQRSDGAGGGALAHHPRGGGGFSQGGRGAGGPPFRGGGRGGPPQRGGGRGGGRGDRGRGGGGAPRASHAPGHMGRAGRPGGFTSMAQDRNLWVHLVQHLRKQMLLPACIFVFSKKRCEENAAALGNQDFSTAQEKSAIHMVIERSIARLKPEDRVLPQILRLRELLGRGIAVHHGGLLPIVKELVEILFAQTLVKVLFATETFAMGLNLPTRTVVFSGYRKHDGTSFRNLLPGEYTQMAGRAGRRGLDTVGTVIIVPPGGSEAPPVAELQTMILGEPSKLRSQFRLTYNMILNLLRVEALKIEEMIKRSFSEHATQQLLPEHEKAVRLSEANLADVKRDPCDICDAHMDDCHAAAEEYRSLTTRFYRLLLGNPAGRKLFAQGRLVVYRQDGGMRTVGVLQYPGPAPLPSRPKELGLRILEVKTRRTARDDADLLPFLAGFRARMTGLPQLKKHVAHRGVMVPLEDVEMVTNWIAQGVVPHIFEGGEAYQNAKTVLHHVCQREWANNWWQEVEVSKIKSLEIQDVFEQRQRAAARAVNSPAHGCPDFLKHFAMCHDQWIIKAHIAELRQALSDQNLQLLPDYEQRIRVLADLGFVDNDSRILLKGKVAAEIHSADELVLTELILDNVLADYDPAEIAALLSAFVFQEKTESVPTLTAALERGREAIVRISEKVNAVQTAHQVILSSDDSNDFVSRPRFGLTEVVYEWARGMPFKNITDLTDVLEGTIVRTITRLDETCREVKNAARIIGDPTLYRKMDAAQELIKRDITAVASLYM